MMRSGWLAAALCAGCAGGGAPAGGAPEAALEAIHRGDFAAAEARLTGQEDALSLRILSRIHMMHHRPREAVSLLERAVRVTPKDPQPFFELAAALVRDGRFREASRIYALVGEEVLSRKYEALGREPAYFVPDARDEGGAHLVSADPMPVVSAAVNGRPGLFAVDTGTAEVALDPAFARDALVRAVGVRTEALQANSNEAILDEVALGGLKVRNVPARLGPSATGAGTRLAGAIGLAFLMQFEVMLDFRRSRLTLRRPGAPIQGVPVYLAGENFLLVRGRLNGTVETFVAVRTAMPRLLAASAWFLEAHGKEVRELVAGPLRIARPSVDTAAFPPGLEASYGLPIGFVLGAAAFRGRVLRLDPRSMRLQVE